MTKQLNVALQLAAAGRRIFPADPESKRPMIEGWLDLATTDASIVRRWWDHFGNAMPAIALEATQLVVDIDPRNGGDATLERLLAEHLDLVPLFKSAPMVKTASGGAHFYFSVPADRPVKNGRWLDGIDVKTKGGFVVAPGAVRADGQTYDLIRDGDAPPAFELVLRDRARGSVNEPERSRERVIWDAGEDHEQAMTRPIVELVAARLAVKGSRHDAARALGGTLALSGWTDEGIAELVRALPSDDPEARVRDALDAAGRARAGEAVPQRKALREAFGERVAELVIALAKQPQIAALEARDAERVVAGPEQSRGGPPGLTQARDPRVDEIIRWLAAPAMNVFQRSGTLTTITREARDDGGIVRPAGAPTIRELVPARLREIIRMTAGSDRAGLAADVLARGEWDDIRPLDAIVTYPVMRRDGTLLTSSGYDAQTRTLAEIQIGVDVPEAPTHDDARAALAALTELVCDFPFASPAHRSAWIAGVLTVAARPAIDGPTPMLLLDANARGAGKTLLADLISIVATGDDAPRRTAPVTSEEWRKVIFAMLLAGDPICLIDNVTHMLASAALDAMLTGRTYRDRVLGVSEERGVAVRTVMMATANNCRISTDLVRRSLHCRLESPTEDPAQRTGFRVANIGAHARRERTRYLGAALTVLRAYAVAGRPSVNARPLGSYEAWCRVVRDALVWAGADDPAETQDTLRETSDVERDELRDLLSAWHEALGDGPVTVRALLDAARSGRPALYDALRGIMPGGADPTAHGIGNRLRALRGQMIGGLVLSPGANVSDAGHGRRPTWRVRHVG
jgi:hypothetical protein